MDLTPRQQEADTALIKALELWNAQGFTPSEMHDAMSRLVADVDKAVHGDLYIAIINGNLVIDDSGSVCYYPSQSDAVRAVTNGARVSPKDLQIMTVAQRQAMVSADKAVEAQCKPTLWHIAGDEEKARILQDIHHAFTTGDDYTIDLSNAARGYIDAKGPQFEDDLGELFAVAVKAVDA